MRVNVVVISGTVERGPEVTKAGSDYGRIRVSSEGYGDRIDLIEVVAKMDKLESCQEGDWVVIRGSISGRENDKGYINMSVFADLIEISGIDSGTDKQYNKSPAKQPPQNSSQRRPARSFSGRTRDDIPF
jgi:hypothetical protein